MPLTTTRTQTGIGGPARAASIGRYRSYVRPSRTLASGKLRQAGKSRPQQRQLSLAEQYQLAYQRANQANEQRYNTILGGYNDRYKNATSQLNQLGTQQTADVNRRYDELGSAQKQDMISRGLTATTIGLSQQNAIERERGEALRRNSEGLARERLGHQSSLSGDRLAFQERRTDAHPDINQLIALQRGLGRQYAPGSSMGYPTGMLGLRTTFGRR